MTQRIPSAGALRLNRRQIEIQNLITVRDRFGGETKAWTTIAGGPVWAHSRPWGTASEVFEANSAKEVAFRYQAFRIRWRKDFDETSRVLSGGLVWDIRGIGVVTRNRTLDLFCASDPQREP